MRRFTNLSSSALVLATMFLLSGCFHRQLLSFDTHPQKPVVLMETLETHDYWLWSNQSHVFWSCAQAGDNLNCTRRCGGGSDLACPQFAIFNNRVGTNTR